MKSFTSVLVLAASAVLVRAQAVYNETTGVFTCPIANAVYCEGDSLTTNIIMRCNGFIGQPGNCDDNLDGEFPPGDSYSPCYATSPSSGIAACSKNCVVYGSSGNTGADFTLPGCVPSTAHSSNSSTPASNSTSATTASDPVQTIVPIVPVGTGGLSTLTLLPSGTGVMPYGGNGTATVYSSGSGAATSAPGSGGSGSGSGQGAGAGSATATPKSPPASTVSAVPTFTGGANTAKAGSALAMVGLFVAAFL